MFDYINPITQLANNGPQLKNSKAGILTPNHDNIKRKVYTPQGGMRMVDAKGHNGALKCHVGHYQSCGGMSVGSPKCEETSCGWLTSYLVSTSIGP